MITFIKLPNCSSFKLLIITKVLIFTMQKIVKRKIDTQKVKKLFEKLGLTQKRLSDETGVPYTTLSYALNGERQIPMEYVFEIAHFFGVSPIDLTIKNDTTKKDKITTQQRRDNGNT